MSWTMPSDSTLHVKFNGAAATSTVHSDTKITAKVPTVTTKGGSASSSTSFTVD